MILCFYSERPGVRAAALQAPVVTRIAGFELGRDGIVGPPRSRDLTAKLLAGVLSLPILDTIENSLNSRRYVDSHGFAGATN
jgi:hypothetical protein